MRADDIYAGEHAGIRPSSHMRWMTWPVVVLMLVLPVTVFMTVASENLLASMLAYLNCLIIVWLMVHMLKRDPLLALLPTIALPLLMMAWPGPTLYFSIMHLDPRYTTLMHRFYHSLQGQNRVQMAVLSFLAGYVPVLLLFFHRGSPEAGAAIRNPYRLTWLILVLCVCITVVHDVGRIFIPYGGESGIKWCILGFYNYCNGLYIVLGALTPYVSKMTKGFLVPFFGAHLFFCAVGNLRLAGLFPLLYFAFGFFFLSGVSQKSKTLAVVVVAIALPLYVLVGNTTRLVMGNQGFANFGHRLDVLLTHAGEVAGKQSAMAATMSRLFMSGGHNIITRTPEEIPYHRFNPASYMRQMVEALVPGVLYYQPDYRGNWHLIRYDFNIGPTSVEISLLGHFWMLGGAVFVFFGGAATACMHGVAMSIVRAARRVSWTKAMVYASILGTTMFDTFQLDFISLFRAVFWRTLMAVLVYQLVRMVVGEASEESLYAESQQTGAL